MNKILFSVVALLMLVACGGGGSSSGGTPDDSLVGAWTETSCDDKTDFSISRKLKFSDEILIRTRYQYHGKGCSESNMYFHRETHYTYEKDKGKIIGVVTEVVTLVQTDDYNVFPEKPIGYTYGYDYSHKSYCLWFFKSLFKKDNAPKGTICAAI